MIITAFDLATATGICDGAPGTTPRLFSWFLSDGGDSHGARLHELHKFLCRYFETQPCDGVVYEAPLDVAALKSMGPRNNASFEFANAARGILVERCHALGKPAEALSVQDARHAVLGWRTNRKKKSGIETKARVMRDVKMLGADFDNDNEADAWVIWTYACHRANPRLAVAMTPLFSGQAKESV